MKRLTRRKQTPSHPYDMWMEILKKEDSVLRTEGRMNQINTTKERTLKTPKLTNQDTRIRRPRNSDMGIQTDANNTRSISPTLPLAAGAIYDTRKRFLDVGETEEDDDSEITRKT